ncbi:hypothetical protein ACF0H5_009860 [Mactra antiquata]
MKSLWESTTCFRAAFLIQVIGIISFIVGFVTDSWLVQSILEGSFGVKQGLWRQCTYMKLHGEEAAVCDQEPTYQNEGWFMAVKTCEILGLVCLILTVFVSVMLMFFLDNRRLARVNCHITSLAGIFILIGNAVFAFKTDVLSLGYSCWLCWVTCVVLVVAAILLECDYRQTANRDDAQNEHVVVVTDRNDDNGTPCYQMQAK